MPLYDNCNIPPMAMDLRAKHSDVLHTGKNREREAGAVPPNWVICSTTAMNQARAIPGCIKQGWQTLACIVKNNTGKNDYNFLGLQLESLSYLHKRTDTETQTY